MRDSVLQRGMRGQTHVAFFCCFSRVLFGHVEFAQAWNVVVVVVRYVAKSILTWLPLKRLHHIHVKLKLFFVVGVHREASTIYTTDVKGDTGFLQQFWRCTSSCCTTRVHHHFSNVFQLFVLYNPWQKNLFLYVCSSLITPGGFLIQSHSKPSLMTTPTVPSKNRSQAAESIPGNLVNLEQERRGLEVWQWRYVEGEDIWMAFWCFLDSPPNESLPSHQPKLSSLLDNCHKISVLVSSVGWWAWLLYCN